MKTKRRKYVDGTCQECGHHKRVTTITFWVNGMKSFWVSGRVGDARYECPRRCH